MNIQKLMQDVERFYVGTRKSPSLFSDEFSLWMHDLGIDFFKVSVGNYVISAYEEGVGGFSGLLADIRKDYKLSQREIGNIVKKSPSTISNYEGGVVSFHYSVINFVCDDLGVSIRLDVPTLTEYFGGLSFSDNFPNYVVDAKNRTIKGLLYSNRTRWVLKVELNDEEAIVSPANGNHIMDDESSFKVLSFLDSGEGIETDYFAQLLDEHNFKSLSYLHKHFDDIMQETLKGDIAWNNFKKSFKH